MSAFVAPSHAETQPSSAREVRVGSQDRDVLRTDHVVDVFGDRVGGPVDEQRFTPLQDA